jgi:hypothetical protein
MRKREKAMTRTRLLPRRYIGSFLGSLALAASPSIAATYFLDQSNVLDDGVPYMQVTVADGADGAIDFTVTVLDALTGLACDDFGIKSFAFNVVAGGSAEAASVGNLPNGWSARNQRRMDGFGLYDIKLVGRHNQLQTLNFSILGVDGDTASDYEVFSTGNAPQGHFFFAAKVADIQLDDSDGKNGKGKIDSKNRWDGRWDGKWDKWDRWAKHWDWDKDWDWDKGFDCDRDKCKGSAFIAGNQVPLPGAAWFFLTGAAGVIVRARRRRKTA